MSYTNYKKFSFITQGVYDLLANSLQHCFVKTMDSQLFKWVVSLSINVLLNISSPHEQCCDLASHHAFILQLALGHWLEVPFWPLHVFQVRRLCWGGQDYNLLDTEVATPSLLPTFFIPVNEGSFTYSIHFVVASVTVYFYLKSRKSTVAKAVSSSYL